MYKNKFKIRETVIYTKLNGYIPFKKFPFGLFTITKITNYRNVYYYAGLLINKNGEKINIIAVDEESLVKVPTKN